MRESLLTLPLSLVTFAIEIPTLVRNIAPFAVLLVLWALLLLGIRARDGN